MRMPVSFINVLIEEVEQSKFDDATPEHLATAFQMVLDHVLEAPQPQVNQQAAAATNFDNIYEDDEEENHEQVGSTAAKDQEEPDLPQHLETLVDDEAQEVPEGEESPSGLSEGEEEAVELAVGGKCVPPPAAD